MTAFGERSLVFGGTLHLFGEWLAVFGERLSEMVTGLSFRDEG